MQQTTTSVRYAKCVEASYRLEESRHGIVGELEWMREDATLGAAQRDRAVSELNDLVAAVDGILQMQTAADADYLPKV